MKPLARFLLIAVTSCILFTTCHLMWDKEPQPQPNAATVGHHLRIAGQDPEPDGIVLDAPEFAEVGELVRFDASSSTVNLTWQILPHTDDFEVIEEGKRAFFSSRIPGQYLVIVAGAKGDQPYLQHFTIVVDGGNLQPGPMTLARKVSAWVRKVEPYEGKHADAKRLAANFRKVASSPDTDMDTILQDTASGNSGALGDNQTAWEPFLIELGSELDAFIDAGELETLEQYKAVWLEIADGIEATIPKDATDLIEQEDEPVEPEVIDNEETE